MCIIPAVGITDNQHRASYKKFIYSVYTQLIFIHELIAQRKGAGSVVHAAVNYVCNVCLLTCANTSVPVVLFVEYTTIVQTWSR